MNTETLKFRFFMLDHKTHAALPGCVVKVFVALRPPERASNKTKKNEAAEPAGAFTAPAIALKTTIRVF